MSFSSEIQCGVNECVDALKRQQKNTKITNSYFEAILAFILRHRELNLSKNLSHDSNTVRINILITF